MRRTKELELDLGEVSNARQDDGRASDPSRTRDHASGGPPYLDRKPIGAGQFA